MRHAVENYASEYAISKKVIGEHSRLYVQKSWSQSAWTELPDTESFVRMLMDQMSNSKRVNPRKELCVKLSFGRVGMSLRTLQHLKNISVLMEMLLSIHKKVILILPWKLD